MASHMLEAFMIVTADIRDRGRVGNSVIVCSIGSLQAFPLDSWRSPPKPYDMINRYLSYLTIAQHAVVVFAAGNAARRSPFVDSFPALFGEDPKRDIIVAGATDMKGFRTPYSQRLKTRPTIWAFGNTVTCARSDGEGSSSDFSGTSSAAALVCASSENNLGSSVLA